MTDQTLSQIRPWALGALGVAALAGLAWSLQPGQTPQDLVQSATASATADAPQQTAEDTAEPVADAPPTFDTFRLDPDGALVVAGRATPGQSVDLILGGEVVAQAMADASGSFVILSTAGESDAPRRLSLLADPEGAAVPSQTSYMVAPITAPVLLADDSVAGADETAPADPMTEATAPAAPVVLQADADGLRVVQGTGDTAINNVVLDAITYDPDGTLQLAGRATGTGEVQIYLDDRPVSTAVVSAGRDWWIDLPDVDTGVYTLRIDELDAAGDVVSRLQMPFKREEPAEIAAVLAEQTSEDDFEVAVRTVQPGSTLWAIAEENLGSGVYYTLVFEANSDLIRDPDLIYPGQIFRIPELAE